MRAFSKLHPITLFTYFAVILLFSMLIRNPVTVCLSLLGSAAFCACLTSRDEKISDARFYIPLAFLVALTNPLFSHNGKTPLFFLNGNPFTLEAVYFGIFIAGMIISVLFWSKAYSKTVTSEKFLFLFGRLIPETALILSVALRYVPMMRSQAKKIKEAGKTLGLYSGGSFTDNAKSSIKVFSALIGWSLENAVETAKTMKARGWGSGKRTSFSVFKLRPADFVFMYISGVFSGVTLVGVVLGKLEFSFYPEITALDFNFSSVFVYICFGLFAFLPFFTELEENIRWNCLRSRV